MPRRNVDRYNTTARRVDWFDFSLKDKQSGLHHKEQLAKDLLSTSSLPGETIYYGGSLMLHKLGRAALVMLLSAPIVSGASYAMHPEETKQQVTHVMKDVGELSFLHTKDN